MFSDIGKSMEDAQQFCESMGGHLATVGDDDKNERLFRLINDSGYDNESFEKEGYDHFMIKEINEQDVAIKNTLAEKDKVKAIVDEVKGTINRVVFVACGTSYHASLMGCFSYSPIPAPLPK